jgi:hypothetical protein
VQVVLENGEPRIQVTYHQRIDDPSLVYVNAVSDNLNSWHSDPLSVQVISILPISPSIQQVTFQDTGTMAPSGRYFGKVWVTETGP